MKWERGKSMATSIKIQQILERKGTDIYSLRPDASVYEAIKMMADKHVGAVLVLTGDVLVGILSERDYARKVILQGKASKQTPVSEIMSQPVHVITPDCTVDEAMSLMTEKRIRHLPVLEAERVTGVISIGDLVRSIIESQEATIQHLHGYITGQYPA